MLWTFILALFPNMYLSADGRPGHLFAVVPLSLVVIIALKRFVKNRQNKPLPGPAPLPLLGNVLSIDTKEPWLSYTDWHAAYGTWSDILAHMWCKLLYQDTWFSCDF
jgi:hypothetical protein